MVKLDIIGVYETSVPGSNPGRDTKLCVSDTEAAYIAGFFDGEGSVQYQYVRATKNGKRYGRLRVTIAQCDREVLDWIRSLVGSGTVYANKRLYERQKRIVHHYYLTNRGARRLLHAMLPFLHVKRAAVEAALEKDAQ